MRKIVYETGEGVEESENLIAYDETTDYWILAPEGEDTDLRRRVPSRRVYFVESDESNVW